MFGTFDTSLTSSLEEWRVSVYLENILPPPGEADSIKSEDNIELSHVCNFDIAYARLEDRIRDEP